MDYLRIAEVNGLSPNFWMSEEYLQRAKATEMEIDGFQTVWDGDVCLFPPIKLSQRIVTDLSHSFDNIMFWSDFEGFFMRDRIPTFLDYEYIFDPTAFNNMSGGRWMVFRKNSRKWSRVYPSHYEKFINVSRKSLESLIAEWCGTLDPEEEVYDSEILIDYVLNGNNRAFLLRGNEPVGVNVWDSNWRYINYRYCVCKREPYLSEYLRLLFYKDMQNQNLLVNDGGVLDKTSLKDYKDKMNPIKVREVKSWSKEESRAR